MQADPISIWNFYTDRDLGIAFDRIRLVTLPSIRCFLWTLSNRWCCLCYFYWFDVRLHAAFYRVRTVQTNPNKNQVDNQRLPCMLLSGKLNAIISSLIHEFCKIFCYFQWIYLWMDPQCTSFPHWTEQKGFEIEEYFIGTITISGRLKIGTNKNLVLHRAFNLKLNKLLHTWCGIIDAKSLFLQPSRMSATEPGACGSSGSGETWTIEIFRLGNIRKWVGWSLISRTKQNKLTVTSMSFTNFHTLCWLIRARNCSFVPIGTAWSTGNSFWFIMACCCFVWFFKCALIARFPLIRPIGGASLYKATSYSNRPGVSSTTPIWRKTVVSSNKQQAIANCSRDSWNSSFYVG